MSGSKPNRNKKKPERQTQNACLHVPLQERIPQKSNWPSTGPWKVTETVAAMWQSAQVFEILWILTNVQKV